MLIAVNRPRPKHCEAPTGTKQSPLSFIAWFQVLLHSRLHWPVSMCTRLHRPVSMCTCHSSLKSGGVEAQRCCSLAASGDERMGFTSSAASPLGGECTAESPIPSPPLAIPPLRGSTYYLKAGPSVLRLKLLRRAPFLHRQRPPLARALRKGELPAFGKPWA